LPELDFFRHIGAMKVWAIIFLVISCGAPGWSDVRPRARTLPAVAEPISTSAETLQAAPVATPDLPEAAVPGPALAAPSQMSAARSTQLYGLRPPARSANLPRTRWQHKAGNALWTRAALSALKSHGKPLVDLVPADIDSWCPAYRTGGDVQRRAFWVGFLSALAKHESTYKAQAVGGGGRWYGLLQILPATARGYKCNAGSGEGLKSGAANLSCAVRIMARTVPRDGVIHGPGGRGVAADWGPMRSARKRSDMAGWLKKQAYCKPLNATRPRARP
jgi:hypothetical protein